MSDIDTPRGLSSETRATGNGGTSVAAGSQPTASQLQLTLAQKLTVEFLGTLLLSFTVCAVTSTGTASGPFAAGLILAAMVFAGGHLSGGVYNPAVTLVLLLRRKLGAWYGASYVGAQLAAAAVAASAAHSLYGGLPSPPSADWRTVLFEGLFTLTLAFVVLAVAASRVTEGNSYFGLAIGAVVIAGACAAGRLSIGAFNPAVVFASTLDGGVTGGDLWLYWLGEAAGALVAVGVFQVVSPDTSWSAHRYVR
jgi:aquaporin Z